MTSDQAEVVSRLAQARVQLVEASELANKQSRTLNLGCDPASSQRMWKIHLALLKVCADIDQAIDNVEHVHEEESQT